MIDAPLARLRSMLSRRLTLVVARGEAEQWGVAVYHGGRRTHWLSPAQARTDALHLLDLANAASRPGLCPEGDVDELRFAARWQRGAK